MLKMSYRLRNFCFTINNYTEEDITNLEGLDYKYLIFGKEKGKEGTPHLQGYCELNTQTVFSKIQKALNKRAHLEGRKGTAKQAIDYCKKDGEVTEYGEPRKQGKRGDLDNIREMAAEQGMREVTSIGNAQQIAVAAKYLTYNEDKRSWKPEVIWISGPSGSGKSYLARELTKEMDTFEKTDSSKWWDGYDKQEAIIWDDFRDTDISWRDLLCFLDRYAYKFEVKGGFRQCLAKTIIITSIKTPEKCYRHIGEDREQLYRRITEHKMLNTQKSQVILETATYEDVSDEFSH